MSSSLRIAVDTSEKEGVTLLVLQGDLDANTFKQLEEEGNKAISEGASDLLLDLSGINYMGSAGLRSFSALANSLTDAGKGKVKLVNPSESVSKILKTLGFDKFFEVHTSFDEAIKSF